MSVSALLTGAPGRGHTTIRFNAHSTCGARVGFSACLSIAALSLCDVDLGDLRTLEGPRTTRASHRTYLPGAFAGSSVSPRRSSIWTGVALAMTDVHSNTSRGSIMAVPEQSPHPRDALRPLPMTRRNQLLTEQLDWVIGLTRWELAWRGDARAILRIPSLPVRTWLREIAIAVLRADWHLIREAYTWQRGVLWHECRVGEHGAVIWSALEIGGAVTDFARQTQPQPGGESMISATTFDSFSQEVGAASPTGTQTPRDLHGAVGMRPAFETPAPPGTFGH